MTMASLPLRGDSQPQVDRQADRSVAAVPFSGKSDVEWAETLLARVRERANCAYADLVNFVCRERIERFKGSQDSNTMRKVDVITSSVAFENGGERYTDIRRNNRALKRISDVSGAWSEGEFCTLLRETIKTLNMNGGRFTAPHTVDGQVVLTYISDVDERNSPWDIRLGSKHYTIPFQEEVWITPASAEILRIRRRATSLPEATYIAEVDWSVNFASTVLDEREFLLPRSGKYDVSYANRYRHEWNTIHFSDYHRYGVEVSVHFR
jgi:hypothetical protein